MVQRTEGTGRPLTNFTAPSAERPVGPGFSAQAPRLRQVPQKHLSSLARILGGAPAFAPSDDAAWNRLTLSPFALAFRHQESRYPAFTAIVKSSNYCRQHYCIEATNCRAVRAGYRHAADRPGHFDSLGPNNADTLR